MQDMDKILGNGNITVKLGDETFTLVTFGPWLLGELTAYIRELRRHEIAANAKDMGIKDIKEIKKLTSSPIADNEFDEYTKQPEVMTELIRLSLTVNHPDFDRKKLATLSYEQLKEISDKISPNISEKKTSNPPTI